MGKKNEYDTLDTLVDLFATVNSSIAYKLGKETFIKHRLNGCPELLFSSYIFNLIDLWMGAHNKGKDDFSEFMDTLKRVGIATYEEYEKEDK